VERRTCQLVSDEHASEEPLFPRVILSQVPGVALWLVSREAQATWPTRLPDLRSRLDAVRCVALEAPDDAVLAAMLVRAFEARAIRPPEDLVAYLVRRIDRSSAAAEAIVARLDALHRPVTRALAAAVLADDTGELFS